MYVIYTSAIRGMVHWNGVLYMKWLSKRAVAEMTGYSEKTIDRAIKRGWLRRAKNGVRRVRIGYDSVVAFMQGQTAKGH